MGFQDKAEDWEYAITGGATVAVGLATGTKVFIFQSQSANTRFPVLFVGLGVGLRATVQALPNFVVGSSSHWNMRRLVVRHPFSGSQVHGWTGLTLSAGLGMTQGAGNSALAFAGGPDVIEGPYFFGWAANDEADVFGIGASGQYGIFFTIPVSQAPTAPPAAPYYPPELDNIA